MFDLLDGIRDHAGLEERLVLVGKIVTDDVAAGVGQRDDAIGEFLLADVGGVEGEVGGRGDVVHDLHHRATFVVAARGEVL